jgi:hypothetical protein
MAEVHPGHMLTGPKGEDEEEDCLHFQSKGCIYPAGGGIRLLQGVGNYLPLNIA